MLIRHGNITKCREYDCIMIPYSYTRIGTSGKNQYIPVVNEKVKALFPGIINGIIEEQEKYGIQPTAIGVDPVSRKPVIAVPMKLPNSEKMTINEFKMMLLKAEKLTQSIKEKYKNKYKFNSIALVYSPTQKWERIRKELSEVLDNRYEMLVYQGYIETSQGVVQTSMVETGNA